jgi:hypothetical protein
MDAVMDVPAVQNDVKPQENRKQLFIACYKRTKNATEAAKFAGYSARSAYNAGYRLMKDDVVKKEIDSWIADEKAKMTRETYIGKALAEYESEEKNPPPVRIRSLELAGQALGYIGSNKIQVNVDQRAVNIEVGDINAMDPAAKWDKIRALLGG